MIFNQLLCNLSNSISDAMILSRNNMQTDNNHPNVPVFVDSVRYSEKTDLIRCYYFFVELDEPNLNEVVLKNFEASFLILELEAVIIEGLNNEYFEEPHIIKELFDFIYDDKSLNISTAYIFLPASLLNRNKESTVQVGDVFRIGLDLFRMGQMNLENPERVIALCKENIMIPEVTFSSIETGSFNKWTTDIIKKVKIEYRESNFTSLRYRNKANLT